MWSVNWWKECPPTPIIFNQIEFRKQRERPRPPSPPPSTLSGMGNDFLSPAGIYSGSGSVWVRNRILNTALNHKSQKAVTVLKIFHSTFCISLTFSYLPLFKDYLKSFLLGKNMEYPGSYLDLRLYRNGRLLELRL